VIQDTACTDQGCIRRKIKLSVSHLRIKKQQSSLRPTVLARSARKFRSIQQAELLVISEVLKMKIYTSRGVWMYIRISALVILSASLANTADLYSFSFGAGFSVDGRRLAQSPNPPPIEVDASDDSISESSAAITGAALAFVRHSRPVASNVVPASIEVYRPIDFSLASRSLPELSRTGVPLIGLLLFVLGLADRRMRKRHRSK
jgi:hypothetical protein